MTDLVNHPEHYQKASVSVTYEPIDITRHYGFDIGNALKYILRAPYKSSELTDLKKAEFYIKDALHFMYKGEYHKPELGNKRFYAAVDAFRSRNEIVRELLSADGNVHYEDLVVALCKIKEKVEELERN